MGKITAKRRKLFEVLGRAKVDPIHIKIDPKVRSIQQKGKPIALRYVVSLNKHLAELKRKVISGLLGSEWARG